MIEKTNLAPAVIFGMAMVCAYVLLFLLMQRHPDGQWVTVKSLETERPRMVTIPASPL